MPLKPILLSPALQEDFLHPQNSLILAKAQAQNRTPKFTKMPEQGQLKDFGPPKKGIHRHLLEKFAAPTHSVSPEEIAI